MPFLSPTQRHTLALICDTLIPRLPSSEGADLPLFRLGAADFPLTEDVEEGLFLATDEASRQQLGWLLDGLENPFFNGLTTGYWRGFSELALDDRTVLLRRWADSSIPQARQFFQSIKRLAQFLFYTTLPGGQPNPIWSSFAYPDQPPSGKPQPRALGPLVITEATTLYTDTLVIGSGAGGGVVAAEVAAAGQDVIVVEKGDYIVEFDGRERQSSEYLFEKRGALTTADRSMLVLAGSVLGGGTTVNWTASLHPPDYVLREWETVYGFSGATSAAFQKSLAAVENRLNINATESSANQPNHLLEKGCQSLGYTVKTVPRNVKGCDDCGFCNYGCAFGAKRGMVSTYLHDAAQRGARILVRAEVERVLIERGQAVGALAQVRGEDGVVHAVTIRAKRVVVSAGSIHTPAILLRSGLGNTNIGRNLHLHPVTVIYGLFEDAVAPWRGAPLTRVVTEFADLDGRGYGTRLECAPTHPGIAALSLPWQSGAAHKQLMSQLNHMANIIIITRDQHSGRVRLDAQGQPTLHYHLHPDDARHMMKGLLEAIRIHAAAGAREISAPFNRHLVYRAGQDKLDSFLIEAERRGFQPNTYSLFSAHQMSSCRIAGDSALGAVDPEGESYEVRNLFVVDGSALPSASGVNPMLSILGTAHYLAQGIKQRR